MQATPQTAPKAAPQIGRPWPQIDGKFAGICTNPAGGLYALVLLDARPSRLLEWDESMVWAQGLDADLPNKVEGMLLFANLKAEFDPEWHWLNTQYSGSDAWGQYIYGGSQTSYGKSAAGRARAVRRFPLQSFNPLDWLDGPKPVAVAPADDAETIARHKAHALSALESQLGPVLSMNQRLTPPTPEELAAPIPLLGCTLGQLIASNEKHAAELQEAIEWVRGLA